MLVPSHYKRDEIATMERACINYAKFEELTDRYVIYDTKMKKNLNYEVLVDSCIRNHKDLWIIGNRLWYSARTTSIILHR